MITRWPMLVMAALTLATAALVGYDLHDRHNGPPLKLSQVLVSWGPVLPPGAIPGQQIPIQNIQVLKAGVDGRELSAFKDKYRAGAVAFHNYGLVDMDDVNTLQKSNAYDIQDGNMDVLIPVNEPFRDELRRGASMTTNYVLVLVPKTIGMKDFDTLRQAKALGVETIGTGSGPP